MKHICSIHGPQAATPSGSHQHQQLATDPLANGDGMSADDVPLVYPSELSSYHFSAVLQASHSPPLDDIPMSHADELSPSKDPSLHGQELHRSSPVYTPPSPVFSEPALGGNDPPRLKIYHPLINGKHSLPCVTLHNPLTNFSGQPCDEQGNYLPPDAPPPPRRPDRAPDDWTPFRSQMEFEMAELLYTRIQMSASNINKLMDHDR
jgi:hypothetical protein